MKTKANTLIEDGQDIKVRNIETNSIVIGGGFDFVFNDDDKITININGADFRIPIFFPRYTTAEIPQGVYEGAVIYDSTLKKCILYNGSAWVNLDGTALS